MLAAVALIAAAAGFAYNAWRTGAAAPAAEDGGALATLMTARFPDLEQRARSVDEWRGRVIVVNFWATWCTPCREEIPLFVKLQKKYGERGLQFVGIAIDDPAKIRPFAAELGMNFPILVAGVDAIDLARKLGNRVGVLPFTLVITRDGKVVSSEIGTAHNAKLEPLLASLL